MPASERTEKMLETNYQAATPLDWCAVHWILVIPMSFANFLSFHYLFIFL